MKLVEAIINGKYDLANGMMAEQFRIILERKMYEAKKKVAAKMCEDDMEKNLPPISQDGVDPNRTAKLASMAGSQPSTVKGPPPTNADKEKAANLEEGAPDNERFDPETGTTTKNSRSTQILKVDKSGQEKKLGGPDAAGDETHMVTTNRSSSSGNSGDSSSTTTSRISQKTIRPDAGDDKGSDTEISASDTHDTQSNQRSSSKNYVPGETPVSEARINIIKARIRGGKIQRRKKVSNVPGMTLRGGQLKRMSAAERRARKLGAKRAKLKTRGKQAQILRKRKVSLQKRQRLGL